ncbi:A/G-specific adenine glycosylase [Enterococcus sp. HY326]|uniref:A/G-specific adenine glycosylase n=1 Tax=Enterococcus sp. HY326 TaxID=2971265 RepID=UPI0022409828|nr:A/G-specific adenine glycosylase [Enterococcus sp. HY326]
MKKTFEDSSKLPKDFEWSSTEIQQFQKDFLMWYQQEKRNLPWRINTDPYRVWISEIMLQQTRVDTVIDYYYRFMEKFPTIQALAEADQAELLKTWEGLGYYSRARNLQSAAQQIMAEFAGEMPQTAAEIVTLKGIGPYTTGAIASIAFNLPEPAIDGNVMRVVSRLFCLSEDISKPSSRKVFDEKMRLIISYEAPGDFNQALMDLGSAICTPKKPDCQSCPIQKYCRAYATQQQENFPVKSKKIKPKDVFLVAGIIENQAGEYLLAQRPAEGLIANMWTFPMIEVSQEFFKELQEKWQGPKANDKQLTLDLVAEESPAIFSNLPVVWQKRHFSEVTHVYSHLKWHVLPFYGRALKNFPMQGNEMWVNQEAFPDFVFPKVQHKLIESWKKS